MAKTKWNLTYGTPCICLDIVTYCQVAGATFSSVIKATVFLADINDFDTVNNVYQMFFQEHFPARAAVQVEQ